MYPLEKVVRLLTNEELEANYHDKNYEKSLFRQTHNFIQKDLEAALDEAHFKVRRFERQAELEEIISPFADHENYRHISMALILLMDPLHIFKPSDDMNNWSKLQVSQVRRLSIALYSLLDCACMRGPFDEVAQTLCVENVKKYAVDINVKEALKLNDGHFVVTRDVILVVNEMNVSPLFIEQMFLHIEEFNYIVGFMIRYGDSWKKGEHRPSFQKSTTDKCEQITKMSPETRPLFCGTCVGPPLRKSTEVLPSQ